MGRAPCRGTTEPPPDRVAAPVRHGAGETVRATPQGVGCHARRSTRPAAGRGGHGTHRPLPGGPYRRRSGDPPGRGPVPATAARSATDARRPPTGRPARTGDAVT